MPSSRVKARLVAYDDLQKLWAPLLRLKEPGFDWTGKSYGRPSRNQGADKPGLVQHKEALKGLMSCVPSGFVLHCSLRSILDRLDHEYGIFNVPSKSRFRTASEACDIWRKMCKDTVSIAKGPNIPDDLADLCALVRLDGQGQEQAQGQGQEQVPAQPHGQEQHQSTFASFSGDEGDSDVQCVDDDAYFVGEVCCCPFCVKERASANAATSEDIEIVSIVAAPAAAAASTVDSVAPTSPPPIPNPRLGAQRKESLRPTKRRLIGKQPDPAAKGPKKRVMKAMKAMKAMKSAARPKGKVKVILCGKQLHPEENNFNCYSYVPLCAC